MKEYPKLLRRILSLGRITIRIIVKSVLIGLILLAIIIGLMYLDSHKDTALPTPSGPFAVGRTSFAWKDSTQLDSMATEPGTKRELIAWIILGLVTTAHC
jgi:hypothetical protein